MSFDTRVSKVDALFLLQDLCFARVKVAHSSVRCAISRTSDSVSSESKRLIHTVATVPDRQDPQK